MSAPAQIALTCGRIALVDPCDVALVTGYTWRSHKISGTRYAVAYCGTGRKDRRTVLMHRLITKPAVGLEVHHRDHDGLNNQRANLMVLTRSLHLHFARRSNRAGYRGVSLITYGSWSAYKAQIRVGKNLHLGCFATAEDAARAYNDKARELFGPDAYQNPLPDAPAPAPAP